MAALTFLFALLAVAGAGAAVLYPGLRRSGLALAATNLFVGLVALTLQAVPVFLAEVVAALLLAGLVQAFPIRGADRALWPPGGALAAPAVLSTLALAGLAWVALQPVWSASPNRALNPAVLPQGQLVALGAAVLLAIAAALAVLTRREPRRAQPVEQPPPRRTASSTARPPRGRGRR